MDYHNALYGINDQIKEINPDKSDLLFYWSEMTRTYFTDREKKTGHHGLMHAQIKETQLVSQKLQSAATCQKYMCKITTPPSLLLTHPRLKKKKNWLAPANSVS